MESCATRACCTPACHHTTADHLEQACACTGLEVCAIGVGAWSWGDRSGYWGYKDTYDDADSLKAYQVRCPVVRSCVGSDAVS